MKSVGDSVLLSFILMVGAKHVSQLVFYELLTKSILFVFRRSGQFVCFTDY